VAEHRSLFVWMTAMAWAMSTVLAGATAQAPTRHRSVVLPGTDIVLEAGWQLVLTADEACAYTVPATWPVAPDHVWATKPDGRISAALAEQPSAAWTTYKQRLTAALQPTAVLDDSDRRLWVERADVRRILHHIALTDGRTICSVDIEVVRSPEPSSEIVSRIVSGLRVTRGRDLFRMKE
jgi:hypothetical protein